MSEEDFAKMARARDRLAAVDSLVADLLAQDDPAAEHAAVARALDRDERALVGVTGSRLDLERSASAGFRRGR